MIVNIVFGILVIRQKAPLVWDTSVHFEELTQNSRMPQMRIKLHSLYVVSFDQIYTMKTDLLCKSIRTGRWIHAEYNFEFDVSVTHCAKFCSELD